MLLELTNILAISLTLHFTHSKFALAEYQLGVSNDGPAMLGVPITFTARLSPPCSDLRPCTFEFDDHQGHKMRVEGRDKVQVNFTYSPGSVGHHKMYVEARNSWLQHLADNVTTFEISDSIPGKLLYFQEGLADDAKPFYVINKRPIEVSLDINDPGGFFRNKSLRYTWLLDSEPLSDDDLSSQNITLTTPGDHRVSTTALYFQPPTTIKYGFFELPLKAIDPISAVTVQGLTHVPHSQMLRLNISCKGGGSVFQYCWLVRNSTNVTHDPFYCPDPLSTTSCTFQVIYYFGQPGEYFIQMYVRNFVDVQYRNISIRILDETNSVGLYEVILPVLAVVLAVMIISASVLLYQHHQPPLQVEVADFDFEAPDTFQDSTFFERLWSSVLYPQCCRGRAPSNLLIDSMEDPSPPDTPPSPGLSS